MLCLCLCVLCCLLLCLFCVVLPGDVLCCLVLRTVEFSLVVVQACFLFLFVCVMFVLFCYVMLCEVR